MNIAEALIPELQHETRLTETFIKRIPADKLDWKPHEKSMTVKQLASHLCEIPDWITGTMEFNEMVMDDYVPPSHNSVNEMLQTLEKNTQKAVASLKKPDEEYHKPWKMVQKGKTMFEMPRYNVLRGMVLGQFPHHRAQLGVYFRLLGLSVPATYGPSADES